MTPADGTHGPIAAAAYRAAPAPAGFPSGPPPAWPCRADRRPARPATWRSRARCRCNGGPRHGSRPCASAGRGCRSLRASAYGSHGRSLPGSPDGPRPTMRRTMRPRPATSRGGRPVARRQGSGAAWWRHERCAGRGDAGRPRMPPLRSSTAGCRASRSTAMGDAVAAPTRAPAPRPASMPTPSRPAACPSAWAGWRPAPCSGSCAAAARRARRRSRSPPAAGPKARPRAAVARTRIGPCSARRSGYRSRRRPGRARPCGRPRSWKWCG